MYAAEIKSHTQRAHFYYKRNYFCQMYLILKTTSFDIGPISRLKTVETAFRGSRIS